MQSGIMEDLEIIRRVAEGERVTVGKDGLDQCERLRRMGFLERHGFDGETYTYRGGPSLTALKA